MSVREEYMKKPEDTFDVHDKKFRGWFKIFMSDISKYTIPSTESTELESKELDSESVVFPMQFPHNEKIIHELYKKIHDTQNKGDNKFLIYELTSIRLIRDYNVFIPHRYFKRLHTSKKIRQLFDGHETITSGAFRGCQLKLKRIVNRDCQRVGQIHRLFFPKFVRYDLYLLIK